MEDVQQRLSALIQKLCNKREADLELSGLAAVKALCKQRDDNVLAAWDALWTQLRASHAQTRLLALRLCAQLFKRSRAFRYALLSRLSQFLEAVLGFRPERPLPPPAQVAASLREEALELLTAWSAAHGVRHKQLPMAVRYLRETLQYRLPEAGARQAAAEAEARAREERQQAALRERLAAMLAGEWRAGAGAARQLVREIEECFELLEQQRAEQAQQHHTGINGSVERQTDGGGEDEEWEDVLTPGDGPASQQLDAALHEGLAAYAGLADDTLAALPAAGTEAHAAGELAEGAGAAAGGDPAVMEALAGLYRQLTNRCLPQIQDFLSVLGRVEPEGPHHEQQRQHLLRAATELRAQLVAAKGRCDAQSLDLEALLLQRERRQQQAAAEAAAAAAQQRQQQQQNGSDVAAALQDVFGASDSEGEGQGIAQQQRVGTSAQQRRRRRQHEEETVEQLDNPYARIVDPTMPRPRAAGGQQAQQAVQQAAQQRRGVPQRQRVSSLPEEVRKKLAAQAPVLPSGPHTMFWDSKSVPTFVSGHGLEISNHWGPVDVHQELPPERVDELFLLPMPANRPQQPQQAQQQQQAQQREQQQNSCQQQPSQRQQHNGGATGAGSSQQLQWPSRQNSAPAGGPGPSSSAAAAAAGAGPSGGRASKRARRADDRAYNDAIIGGALSDELLARQLQDADLEQQQAEARQQEQTAQRGGRRGRQAKKMSVKDRLAQKLLRGGAVSAALRDVIAEEGAMQRERAANRW